MTRARRRLEPVSLDQRLADGRLRHETIAAPDTDIDAGQVLHDTIAIMSVSDDDEALVVAQAAAAKHLDCVKSEWASPQQARIIDAQLALLRNGLEPSHHAVARLLGLKHGNVKNQWDRMVARLRAEVARGDLAKIKSAFPAA